MRNVADLFECLGCHQNELLTEFAKLHGIGKLGYRNLVGQERTSEREVGIVCSVSDDNIIRFEINMEILLKPFHAPFHGRGRNAKLSVFRQNRKPMKDRKLRRTQIQNIYGIGIDKILISITVLSFKTSPLFGKLNLFSAIEALAVIIKQTALTEFGNLHDIR